MKTWQDTMPFSDADSLWDEFLPESTLFFDIETTGFSRSETTVYLIGCAAKEAVGVRVTQFFAERPEEEKQLLETFLKLASRYRAAASFNGLGFDVPYLKSRCAVHGLEERLDSLPHTDIYKEISGLRHILKLPNLKQKTLESFLGVARDDVFSGGELISVYHDYVRRPSAESCALLKLHNYDDMAGMPALLPLLSYRRLFDGCFQILSREEKDCASPDGRAAREFLLTLGLMHPLPKPIFAAAGGIALTGAQASATLSAPIFQGELRHFYPNYKDYYYLPAEDMAIHKSVAAYVDKDYRVKATAANCYVRREGKFLPQYGEPRFPCFFSAYKGKERYFEMTEEFFGSKEALKDYAMSLLSRLAETVR